MKCPYCNKTLKTIKFNDTFTCINPNCKQSLGIIGTEIMWEKVAQLAKIRAAGRKYIRNNPEKTKERHAKYYQENKEKVNEQLKQWRKANPEKVKQYALKSKDKKRAYMKKWRKAHPDYMRNYYQKLKQGGNND